MDPLDRDAAEAVGRSVFRPLWGLLRNPMRMGEDASGVRIPDVRNAKVLDESQKLVGKLRWSTSGPNLTNEWRISIVNRSGRDNDFAAWMHGRLAEPPPDGRMNCWEAVMYTAYKADAVDVGTLRELHIQATANARVAYAATADETAGLRAYNETISDYLGPGKRTPYTINPRTEIGKPGIPAGRVVFATDLDREYIGPDHVMLSLGTRNTQGGQEVLSLGNFPLPIAPATDDVMQRTTIEGYLSASRMRDPRVESAVPSWLL